MKRDHLMNGLAGTVRTHEATYQVARAREPRLADHATAIALFDALAPRSGLTPEARAWLLHVVAVEYQRGRHALWHALAARGLEPMLGRLRTRMRGPAEERDQAIHIALAEELARLRVARADGLAFPLLTLRRALERALLTTAADRERELEEQEAYMDYAGRHTQQPHEDAPPFVECLAAEVGQLLVERSGGDDVVRVLVGAETLGDQSERLSTEHVSKECLQKRHRRTVVSVRGALSARES
jgi:hypothetical protein